MCILVSLNIIHGLLHEFLYKLFRSFLPGILKELLSRILFDDCPAVHEDYPVRNPPGQIPVRPNKIDKSAFSV